VADLRPSDYFAGKRVTVMGLGLLGRGVNDVRFLAEHGARLTVTDLKSAEELAPSLARLAELEGIAYVLGEHRLEDFREADFVLKAAGVPLDSPFVAEARRHDVPVEMDEALFARLSGATIVGVTGTRGKTTTTLLLHRILEQSGLRTLLGGNIKDVATLPLLDVYRPGDTIVLELSSWQLQGFGNARLSPHVAVFTNFLPDHLNYYGGDLQRYFDDKSNIFRFQGPADVLVASPEAVAAIEHRYPGEPAGELRVADAATLDPAWQLRIPGRHNRANAVLAVVAARALGVDDAITREAVESFEGAPERLELVRELRGVRFYNDTTATTPEATLAAVEALAGDGRTIVLIAGGADKGLDYGAVAEAVGGAAKALVLLPGSASPRIVAALAGAVPVHPVETMAEAVHDAAARAKAGDAVLLSPAAASFGLFENEFDRGSRFVAAVAELL
jgi:UDP-N-acetylmuramoylalanine--D-glutamate ligase